MPNVSVPTAIKHREEIISRLTDGELVTDIAASLGCSRQVITLQLAHDPEYQAAGIEAIEARMEMYENQLATAPDGLSLARADKLLAQTRWMAERRNPQRWGQMKQAVQVNAADGQVQVNIVSYSDSNEAT